MKNAVMVVLVALLATILSPMTAEASFLYDSHGNIMGATEDGGQALRDGSGRRISAYEYANGRPDSNDRGRGNGGGYRNDNYGYSSGSRSGNQNRTSVNVGLGTRIGGVRVNLGYNKVTYSRSSKPKPYVYKPQVVRYESVPIVVVPVQKPTPISKCRMTLVEEIGDGLETISDIVVTNPDKDLSPGKRIVFKRNGQFFAEYSVDRVSGDTVFVETVDAPRGHPRKGDSFKICPEPENINTAE